MAIRVQKMREDEYQVVVQEANSESRHTVRLRLEYVQKLTGGKATTEELVRRSFEFLLAREPKEQILREFDLSVIARYFPEYEREIRKALDS